MPKTASNGSFTDDSRSGQLYDDETVELHGTSKGNHADSKHTNKMNTSSTAGRGGGQAKGGGSPHATSENFGPSPADIGRNVGGGSPQGDSGDHLPPGTKRIDRDREGNESLSSNQNYIRPGETASGPERLDNQQGGQQSPYDDHDNRPDLRSQEAMKDHAPDLHAQQKDAAKKAKKDAKTQSKIPNLDLRAMEGAGSFTKVNTKEKVKGKVKQYVKKKKWKFVAGGIGIGGAFFILMLLMFLLGALLIPHFVSNVVGWQFVKVTRAAYESTQEVMEEQITVHSNPAAEANAAEKYKDDSAFTEEEDLTPEKMNTVEKNMISSEVHENATSSGKITSVTYENQNSNTFTTKPTTGAGFNGTLEDPTALGNAAAEEDLTTAAAAEVNVLNPNTGDSGITADPEVVQGVDASPTEVDTDAEKGEDPSKFPDTNSDQQNEVQAEGDAYGETNSDLGLDSSPLPSQNKDADGVSEAVDAAAENPTELKEIVDEDGNLPNSIINLLNGEFVQNALDSVANKVGEFLNPATGKLIPFCIVDEGSKFNGPTAQAQSQEVQRSAVQTMAVADQEKRGSPYTTAGMVSAWSWKLDGDPRNGGITDSIPIQRASGQKVSTTSQLSTEASPLGSPANSGNILSALGIPDAGALQSALDTICPAITNIWVNLALGVGNLTFLVLSAIFTGGAGDVAEGAADAGADEAANVATDTIMERIISAFSTKEGSSGFDVIKDFGTNLIKQGVIQGGLVAMATFIAKFLVLSQAAVPNNGLSTGASYDNGVDQGTGILTNAIVAHAYGGRPLTNTESVQVQQDDNKTLAELNSSQSAYQRYLALSNPQSLASIMTDRIAVNLNYGFFNSVLADMGNIFNPAGLIPQVLFGKVSGQANAAATNTTDTQDYGDVQQGYSDAEYALIASQVSYKSPSENQYKLDQSDDESEIAQTYGPCFNDSVALLLSIETNGVPDIVRDGNGEISQTQGLCSPQNLGPDNPQYGDLVFRYRLSLSYNTTLDMLEGVANAT
jgi:hypothetical protein